jgi:hypothetical protein
MIIFSFIIEVYICDNQKREKKKKIFSDLIFRIVIIIQNYYIEEQ